MSRYVNADVQEVRHGGMNIFVRERNEALFRLDEHDMSVDIK